MTAAHDRSSPPVYFHRGTGGHSWSYAVIDGFQAAFEGMGYTCHAISDAEDGVREKLTGQALAGEEAWVIDLNGRLRFPPGVESIKKFSIVVDHPFLRTDDLAAARPGDAVGLCDRSHLAAMTPVRRDLRAVFLAHAGPSPSLETPAFAKRTLPLLFAGSLPAYSGTEQWRAQNPEVPEEVAGAVIQAADAMVSEAEPVLPALQAAFKDRSVDLFAAFSAATLMQFVEETERLAEQISRSAMLLALRGLPLHLIAPGVPDFLKPLPDHWTFHGECTVEELRRLMIQTKIVLNPVVKFPFGAHDRVFHAQAEGAAVATPYSHFLAQDYRDGDSILFVDPNREAAAMASRVADLLADDAALGSLAAAGQSVYATRHTWMHRAAEIAAVMSDRP